jgi:hypothetical protein
MTRDEAQRHLKVINSIRTRVPFRVFYEAVNMDLMPGPIAAYASPGSLNSLLKKSLFEGCSKMPRCKAPEILSREAYF